MSKPSEFFEEWDEIYPSQRQQTLEARKRRRIEENVRLDRMDSDPRSQQDYTRFWDEHFRSQSHYIQHIVPAWDHHHQQNLSRQQRATMAREFPGHLHNWRQVRALRQLRGVRFPNPMPNITLRPPIPAHHHARQMVLIAQGQMTPPGQNTTLRHLHARFLLQPWNRPFPEISKNDFFKRNGHPVGILQIYPKVDPGQFGTFDPDDAKTFEYAPLHISDAQKRVTHEALIATKIVREHHSAAPNQRFPETIQIPTPGAATTAEEDRRYGCLICETEATEVVTANKGNKAAGRPLAAVRPRASMTKAQISMHVGFVHQTPVGEIVYTHKVRRRIRTRHLSAHTLHEGDDKSVNRWPTPLSRDDAKSSYIWLPEHLDLAQAQSINPRMAEGDSQYALQPKITLSNAQDYKVAGPTPPARRYQANFTFKSPINFGYLQTLEKHPSFQKGLPYNQTGTYQSKFPDLYAYDLKMQQKKDEATSVPLQPGERVIAVSATTSKNPTRKRKEAYVSVRGTFDDQEQDQWHPQADEPDPLRCTPDPASAHHLPPDSVGPHPPPIRRYTDVEAVTETITGDVDFRPPPSGQIERPPTRHQLLQNLKTAQWDMVTLHRHLQHMGFIDADAEQEFSQIPAALQKVVNEVRTRHLQRPEAGSWHTLTVPTPTNTGPPSTGSDVSDGNFQTPMASPSYLIDNLDDSDANAEEDTLYETDEDQDDSNVHDQAFATEADDEVFDTLTIDEKSPQSNWELPSVTIPKHLVHMPMAGKSPPPARSPKDSHRKAKRSQPQVVISKNLPQSTESATMAPPRLATPHLDDVSLDDVPLITQLSEDLTTADNASIGRRPVQGTHDTTPPSNPIISEILNAPALNVKQQCQVPMATPPNILSGQVRVQRSPLAAMAAGAPLAASAVFNAFRTPARPKPPTSSWVRPVIPQGRQDSMNPTTVNPTPLHPGVDAAPTIAQQQPIRTQPEDEGDEMEASGSPASRLKARPPRATAQVPKVATRHSERNRRRGHYSKKTHEFIQDDDKKQHGT